MTEYKVENHVSSFCLNTATGKWSGTMNLTAINSTKQNGDSEIISGEKDLLLFTHEGVYVDGESNLHIAMVKKRRRLFFGSITNRIAYL